MADAGVLNLEEGAEPSAPAAGFNKVYVDQSDGLLKKKDSSGTVITLGDIQDTDDLPEGSTNLYHTDERAQDAVGNILTDSSTVDFTYNDAGPSITAAVIADTSTQRVEIQNGGSPVGTRKTLNITGSTNITVTSTDDGPNNRVNITVSAAGLGTGDVIGPSSATDNAIARYDSTTGKLIQNSAATLSDAGKIETPDTVRLNSYTEGSVLYTDADGDISEANANLFWHNTNKRLIVAANGDTDFSDSIASYGGHDSYLANADINFAGDVIPGSSASTSRGTGASPVVSNSGDLIGRFGFYAYTGSVPTFRHLAYMASFVDGVSSDKGAYTSIFTTADGSATAVERVRIKSTGETDVLGTFQSEGAHTYATGNVRTITTNATVNATDIYILVDTTGGAVILTLPDPATRRKLVIRDVGDNLSVNALTIARFGTESIDGVAGNLIYTSDCGSIELISDGTDWWRV